MAEDATVRKKLDELEAMFRERISHDETQKKAFDLLYQELRQYKDDFVFQLEKPFLLDLLLFYDSLSWFQQSLQKNEMSPEVVQDSFQYLVDEFLELLYRRDIAPCESVERFDRKLHKAVRVTRAESAEDDWRIRAVLKRGFLRGDRVLRPEEVAVARYGTDIDPKDSG